MKKSLFLGLIILTITGVEIFGASTITNWRWRSDDGDEGTAPWKAALNDSVIQANESKIRLRIQMYHREATPVSFTAYLYYASLKDTIWHLVSEDPNDAFMFTLSPWISNGGITTQQIFAPLGPQSFKPGVTRELSGPFDFSLGQEESTEYEFCIKPSPFADFDQSYIFNIEDDNPNDYTLIWFADSLPRIHLQKPELTITANNSLKTVGSDNPVFTVDYAGFVDGDNASDLYLPPNISCSANASSPVGNYDIVPYGAADNKYKFNYVTGVLKVTDGVGVEEHLTDKLSLYPNPAHDIIYISGIVQENSVARIYNLAGKLVLEANIDSKTINISSLNKGVYILNINEVSIKINKQ